jgi:S1-C subfamily serine protease
MPLRQQDIQALVSFLHNFHWGKNLSPEDAKRNVELGIIELSNKSKKHCANGLLVTTSGYFLTSYHCVEEGIGNLVATMSSGQRLLLDKVCAYNAGHDIALVRTKLTPGTGLEGNMIYKYFDEKNIRRSKALPLVALTRRDGKLLRTGGLSKDLKIIEGLSNGRRKIVGHHTTDMQSRPGDSGGTVVSAKGGELVGILSSVVAGANIATYVVLNDALTLIAKFCAKHM